MPDSEQQPLFILAPPRSYTSLVCAMIGQHPQMYGLPELNLFLTETMGEFLSGVSNRGSRKSPFWPVMRHGLLRTVAQLYAGEQTIESIAMAYRWITVRKEMGTDDAYRILCRQIAPLLPVDKSPAYIAKMEYLKRLAMAFPNARFIHLLRHPRGQCESALKAKGGVEALLMAGAIDLTGEEPVVDPQIAWHDINLRIMTFLDKIPKERWLRIKGEDLILHNDKMLTNIVDWLELQSGTCEIELMKHPEDSPYAFVGPVNARLGNDINFLKKPELRPARVAKYDLGEALSWRTDKKAFDPRVIQLANEFGYE